ncbi:hypothetical protein [Stieleria mannarensis]|uniref:hypothetical protein n=1 Tax=Stieleria mannarensis TaxID=2755585 RepID=UPI0016000139|nr:hypothetical protein [Rhodopirellula sp. JC639]
MKRLRFSIRTLLLLAAVTAIGIFVYQRQTRIREIVQRFESLGGEVHYRSSFLDGFHRQTRHFFATPTQVNLSHSRLRRGGLDGIEHLKSLQRLYLDRTAIGVDDVAELAECKQLKRMSLWGNHNLTSNAVDHLLDCQSLEALDIHDTRIAPAKVGRLGELPLLQRLVFSAEYYNQKSSRMTGGVMRQLSSIEHLQPVGSCFLWDFDAEEIQLFCRTDTSRVDKLLLRDCELTDEACLALNTIRARELDLQRCTVDDRRLQLIDHRKFGRIDIFNSADVSSPGVTLKGLTEWLPSGLKKVGTFDGYVEFIYQADFFWRYRLSIAPTPISQDLLQSWIDLGLKELDLNVAENLEDDLEVVASINPPIELRIRNHLFVWQYIARMNRLQKLRLYNRISTPLRLTDGLSLRSLDLQGRFYTTKTTFREIAKLKRLSFLVVRNRNQVTLDDVQPLGELKQLTTIRIAKLTPEAEAFVERLCAQNASGN